MLWSDSASSLLEAFSIKAKTCEDCFIIEILPVNAAVKSCHQVLHYDDGTN